MAKYTGGGCVCERMKQLKTNTACIVKENWCLENTIRLQQ